MEKKTKFITYYQNNSGGYFIDNDFVKEYVIIEGEDFLQIQKKARDLFSDYRSYCPCCGQRWDDDWKDEDDLDNEPMIYDVSVYEYKSGSGMFDKGAIIHWIDGAKEVVEFKSKTLLQ